MVFQTIMKIKPINSLKTYSKKILKVNTKESSICWAPLFLALSKIGLGEGGGAWGHFKFKGLCY